MKSEKWKEKKWNDKKWNAEKWNADKWNADKWKKTDKRTKFNDQLMKTEWINKYDNTILV